MKPATQQRWIVQNMSGIGFTDPFVVEHWHEARFWHELGYLVVPVEE